jgi:DNA recombination-dependent growth factor C
MGLLSSSTQFVRYAVEGDLPADFWNFAAERIAAASFRDIDDTYDERSVGWVSVDNMFDNRFEGASFAVADYLVLSLRIDERKVGPAVLKKFCMKEEEKIKRERQIPRLNRRQRVELKENVRIALMKKAVPVASVYDLCWNLSQGSLLFFSTNMKAHEIIEDLFKETFGLRLVLQIPYLSAAHLLNQNEQKQLAGLEPDVFI